MKNYPEASLLTTGRDVRTDTSVSSNANHETAIKAPSKPKRRTKTYRAIQRPDGVVIERPRYLPAGSHQKSGTKVDGDRASPGYIILAGDIKEQTSKRMDYYLLGIGFTASDTGSGDNGGLAAEGGNYVVPQPQEPTRSAADVGRQQRTMASTPVERFLSEQGSWSSFSPRGRRV